MVRSRIIVLPLLERYRAASTGTAFGAGTTKFIVRFPPYVVHVCDNYLDALSRIVDEHLAATVMIAAYVRGGNLNSVPDSTNEILKYMAEECTEWATDRFDECWRITLNLVCASVAEEAGCPPEEE